MSVRRTGECRQVLLGLALILLSGTPAMGQSVPDVPAERTGALRPSAVDPDSLRTARRAASRSIGADSLMSARSSPTQPPPLPPLSRLLKHAREHAPQIATQEAIIAERTHQVKQAEQQWMETITIGATASYGSFGNSVLDAVKIGQRAEVGVQLSLSDLFGRESVVGVRRQQLTAARQKRRTVVEAVRSNVIDQYYATKQAREMTLIQSRRHVASRTHLQMAKSAFRQGTLSIEKVSQVTSAAAKAEARFRKARLQYEQAYKQLERLVGLSLDTLRRTETQPTSTAAP